MTELETKQCNKCLEYKEISYFGSEKRKNGIYINPKCKQCVSLQKKSYREKNKEIISAKNKDYKLKNKIIILEYEKQRYEKNKSIIIEKTKKYYYDNREICIARASTYAANTSNRDKINKRVRKYKKERKATDPYYKIREIVSGAVYSALKANNSSKENNSCFKYLPFDIKQLKEYLESKFEPWMTWSNWGTYNKKIWNDNDPTTWRWNIDHIIPQSKLLYSSMEDENFKKCWSLNNLRPYSAKQNIIDGCRR